MGKFKFPKNLKNLRRSVGRRSNSVAAGGSSSSIFLPNEKSSDLKPLVPTYTTRKQAKLHHRSLISSGYAHTLSGGRTGSGKETTDPIGGGKIKDPVQSNLEQNQDLTSWNNLKPGTSLAPSFLPDPLKKLIAAGTAVVSVIEGAPSAIVGALQGEGLLYPGSNYIGPLNKLDEDGSAPPNSQMDYLARIHDYQYGQLEAQGVNPYFTFNEADRYMLAHADLTTAEGWAIYVGIGLKQIFPDDYTSVDPVPAYGGRGETSPTSSYQEMRVWENRSILRAEMMERLQQVGEQIAKEVSQPLRSLSPISRLNENKTEGSTSGFINLKGQAEHLTSQFISSALGQIQEAGKGAIGAIGGAVVGDSNNNNKDARRHHHLRQLDPPPEPRDLGKDPLTRRFLLGGSATEMVPTGRSAIAHRSLLNSLQSRSSALPFLSTSRASSFSSARANVVSSSMRGKNQSSIQAMHGKQNMRNYKQNSFQPPPLQHHQSRGGLYVPSFVRR